jgi:excisionase family DNA binding protein
METAATPRQGKRPRSFHVKSARSAEVLKQQSVAPQTLASILRQQSAVMLALAGVLETSETPSTAGDLLTVDEAAAVVKTKARVIYRRIEAGALAATKPSGTRGWRIRRGDLMELFAPKLRLVAPKSPRKVPVSEDDLLLASLEDAGISLGSVK